MSAALSYPDFLERFGSTMSIGHAQYLTGLNYTKLQEIARERKFVFADKLIRPRGLKHLPSLPSDAIAHCWEKGTTYTIPADTPGYISLCIHTSAQPRDAEDNEEEE